MGQVCAFGTRLARGGGQRLPFDIEQVELEPRPFALRDGLLEPGQGIAGTLVARIARGVCQRHREAVVQDYGRAAGIDQFAGADPGGPGQRQHQ